MAREFKPLKSARIFDTHSGYCPREVSHTDMKSSPMKEMLLEETVPFFMKEQHGLIFTCNLAEKIRMLEILQETDYMRAKNIPVYFVWPGKRQSHVFEVESTLQPYLLKILKGEDERKEKILDQIHRIEEDLQDLKQELRRSVS